MKGGHTKNWELIEFVKLLTPPPVNVKFINEVKSTSESKGMNPTTATTSLLEILINQP